MRDPLRESLRTPNLGTGMLENRDRIAFADLRQARRDRVLAAMAAEGLDACIFGREGNVRYVTGARRLWTAGSRPFMPSCAIVRATGAAHLLSHSASYEGMPEELAPDEIFPLTWDPARLARLAAATPGLAAARRIGVDGMTPLFRALLGQVLPDAVLVPAEPMMRALRRRKLPDEIACIRTAAAIAESALYEAALMIAPGVGEKELQAAYMERMCTLGTSQFAQQGTFTAIGADGGLRRLTGDRALAEGEMVALAGGVLWAGYEGSLARTWWCGLKRDPEARHRALHALWRDAAAPLIDRCRPGATGADLRATFGATEAARAGGDFAVYSLGLGHEGFIAATALDPAVEREQGIAADMVLGVRIFAPGPAGGYLGEEMILTRDGAPALLTTLGHGPLAANPVTADS